MICNGENILVQDSITFDNAVHIVNGLLLTQAGKELKETEILVLKASWDDVGYEEIAEGTPHNADSLRCNVANQLWRKLTEVMDCGEKVTKKRFRPIVENLLPNIPQRSRKRKPTSLQNDSRVDGLVGKLPDVSGFHGRVPLLALLKKAVNEDRCILLRGMAGVGKSALAAKLIEEIRLEPKPLFPLCIWKSVHHAPTLQDLLSELIGIVEPNLLRKHNIPKNTQAKISLLIKLFSRQRYLIVLNSAESLLQGDRMTQRSQYGEYYEYESFIRQVIEQEHQSCLILTSREPFAEISTFVEMGNSVRIVSVEGLGKDAMRIFQERGLKDEDQWGHLIANYRGNPLALRIVAARIQQFFGGSVKEFAECETTFLNDIFKASLDDYFGENPRLTHLEGRIMYYLAQELEKESDAMSFSQLLNGLKSEGEEEISVSSVIESLEALLERALVENRESGGQNCYGLQPVIKKYLMNTSLGGAQEYAEQLKTA